MTNIIVNLVSNAIKFTSKGGVQVYVHWFPDTLLGNNTNLDSFVDNNLLDEQSEKSLKQVKKNRFHELVHTSFGNELDKMNDTSVNGGFFDSPDQPDLLFGQGTGTDLAGSILNQDIDLLANKQLKLQQ